MWVYGLDWASPDRDRCRKLLSAVMNLWVP